MRRVFAYISLVLFFACSSPNYAYRASIAQVGEDQGAVYEIGKSAGSVDVISFGPIELKQPGMSPIRMMKMRMIVRNDSGAGSGRSGTGNQSWTLNTARQWLVFPEHGSSQPAYIGLPDQVRLRNPPEIKIPGHETRTVDLYYPLPRRFQTAAKIPKFLFQWQLQAGPNATALTTIFDRFLVQGKQIARVDVRDLTPWNSWIDVGSDVA